MNRINAVALTLCLAAAVSVAAQGKTQKISKNLVNKAKDTVKEVEKVSKQLDKTMEQQKKLLGKEKLDDRRKEHRKLTEEVKKTEEAVAKVRKKAEEMEKEADKFFTKWNEGLAEIEDTELRALSKGRFDSTRSQYAQIIGAGNLAATHYDEFLTGLKNELAYLDLDLSDEAIAQLRPKTRETEQRATELDRSIDELTRKIDDYMASMR